VLQDSSLKNKKQSVKFLLEQKTIREKTIKFCIKVIYYSDEEDLVVDQLLTPYQQKLAIERGSKKAAAEKAKQDKYELGLCTLYDKSDYISRGFYKRFRRGIIVWSIHVFFGHKM
jgi:hypothetical protein